MVRRYRDKQPDLIDQILDLFRRVSRLESVNRITHTAVDFGQLRYVNGSVSFADGAGDVPIRIGKDPNSDRFNIRFEGDSSNLWAEIGQLINNEHGVFISGNGHIIRAISEPGIRIVFDHVPATNESDLLQVVQTHESAGELMTMWMNERGMLRLEQRQGSRFDNLYLAIMDGAADPGGSGWPFSIERRDSGLRTRIGGFNWYGQYSTELFQWIDITDVDPDSTGNYTVTGTTGGAAPLSVRLDTSEIVRIQGRVLATDMVANERVFTFPSGYFPLSRRLHPVALTDGNVISCELLPTGYAVTKATIAGTVEMSFDDITFSRVFTEQPTGGWTIDMAAIATPDTTSPLTLNVSSESDTAYVLFLARSTATDPFTGVTDDGSNTWIQGDWAPKMGGAGRRIEVWTLIPSTPFTSVSVAFSGGGTAYASLYKVTGYDPSNLVDDVVADFRTASTTPAAVEATASQPDNIAIAAAMANPNSVASMTPSAGWTSLTTNSGGPAVVYMVDPPLTSAGVDWTFSTSAGSGHAIIILNIAP